MSSRDTFASPVDELVPSGDRAREAVAALEGYAYQILAAALAWVESSSNERIYLEVAEDYALAVEDRLEAVQVRRTEGSGSITLNNRKVQDAIASFVGHVARNPRFQVSLSYLTTSEIGTERPAGDWPAGMAGLEYWRKAAAGADVAPLRTILEADPYPDTVKDFVRQCDDDAIRSRLLKRIRWEAGQPRFADLREQLERRLVVLGRDLFGLPIQRASTLADTIAFRVLEKSVLKTPAERVLQRDELYELIERSSRVSVPQATLDAILGRLGASLLGGGTSPLEVAHPDWLIAGGSLPRPGIVVRRSVLERTVTDALAASGAAILHGASGLGKSQVARLAAETHAAAYLLIDLRVEAAADTRARLDVLLGRIGAFEASVVVFEDLNHLEDPGVLRSFARVVSALRRRDQVAVLTCYRAPSARQLSDAGIDPRGSIECPYFDLDETRELVRLHDGDPDRWGRLAYAAGAAGHPQLTHAFISGLAARGWPAEEMREIVGSGLTSGDIDAERAAARRELNALPESARTLLYRLSLMSGGFGRATGLALAGTPPPVDRAGEAMDLLIGPWIETTGRDRYRVSPLARTMGRDMLPEAEQQRLHGVIAVRYLSNRVVNANDFDTILVHALVGKADQALVVLSNSVIGLPEGKLSELSESATLFCALDAGRPIYPSSPVVSALLRLAQFKLLTVTSERSGADAVATASLRDASRIPDDFLRIHCELMILGSVLTTPGVADFLDDWVGWLQRWKDVLASPVLDAELRSTFERVAADKKYDSYAMVFSMGSSRLTSVGRLEKIIDDLDGLSAAERNAWLSPSSPHGPDFTVFINAPWAHEESNENFDVADAETAYARIAVKTGKWGIRSLAFQPWLARAVLHDERLGDGDRALAVLDEAVEELGDHRLVSRARAKIFWRRGDHSEALSIMRGIADLVGEGSAVERAYALRQAAISAAECADWRQAIEWFLEARTSAAACETDDMRAMGVGLGADAALALHRDGRTGEAIRGLEEALTALAEVDSSSLPSGRFVHVAVRSAVFSLLATVEGETRGDSSMPFSPGACSNPQPPKEIMERRAGSIDLSWYVLATVDVTSGLDVGVADRLPEMLSGGEIPQMEANLRLVRMRAAIERSDGKAFAESLHGYVDAASYLASGAAGPPLDLVAADPPRGTIPSIDHGSASAETIAVDAITCFGLRAFLAERHVGLTSLLTELRALLGDRHLGHRLLDGEDTRPAMHVPNAVCRAIVRTPEGRSLEPRALWWTGMWSIIHLHRSRFSGKLIPVLADWLRERWHHAVEHRSFRLTQPSRTIPPIRAALSEARNDGPFVAALLLAAADAAIHELPSNFRSFLEHGSVRRPIESE
ncbi:hypothetical protein HCU64_12715 [Methylobacterium sp. C25]|uniref:hypothetical protein n=1 Tax=Methylobacterium sp. C25 TaxID=2721622 RepID=UPI001F430B38|nr:hypothetical protein [Methylobacterium sp. C25]MCE4224620.1 hypothetical protein [Methylobacterium sp. C25]